MLNELKVLKVTKCLIARPKVKKEENIFFKNVKVKLLLNYTFEPIFKK